MRDGPVRVAAIGLDGAELGLLLKMIDSGCMPNLERWSRTAAYGYLESTIPTNSMAAWASFMTGKNPSRHGIFGFTARDPHVFDRQRVVNFSYLREPPLWHAVNQAGMRSCIVNVPFSYPPCALDGTLVTGMLTPSTEVEFTYPPELGPELLGRFGNYPLDVDWSRYEGRPVALVDDLIGMTQRRAEATCYLLDRCPADFLLAVFVAPDRLHHALWRYIDATHPCYCPAEAETVMVHVRRFYEALDAALARVVSALGSGATVFLFSDHGFQSAHKRILINDWLCQMGFLRMRSRAGASLVRTALRLWRSVKRRAEWRWPGHLASRLGSVRGRSDVMAIDWANTQAYATWHTQQGVSVNLAGREPQGVVPPARFLTTRDTIVRMLRDWRDPETGRQVIGIVRNAQADSVGRFADADILIVPGPGYAFSAGARRQFELTGWESGGHSLMGALFAFGCDVEPGLLDGARIVDLAPSMLYALGCDVPSDMDGQVLVRLYGTQALRDRPVRFCGAVQGGPSMADAPFSQEEQRVVEDRLRGLGYL